MNTDTAASPSEKTRWADLPLPISLRTLHLHDLLETRRRIANHPTGLRRCCRVRHGAFGRHIEARLDGVTRQRAIDTELSEVRIAQRHDSFHRACAPSAGARYCPPPKICVRSGTRRADPGSRPEHRNRLCAPGHPCAIGSTRQRRTIARGGALETVCASYASRASLRSVSAKYVRISLGVRMISRFGPSSVSSFSYSLPWSTMWVIREVSTWSPRW